MPATFYTSVQERFSDWTYCHPHFLYAFVRAMKPQSVVEIGCYRALTACWIGRALQENNTGKLITIDNWSLTEHVDRYGDPRAHAEGNLKACGVDGWVEIRQGQSDDAALWPERVDMAYIDGWHSYWACRSDFKMALQRGAYLIALDDTENCVGPRMFSEQAFSSGLLDESEWQKLDLHSDNGLTMFLKRQEKRPITFSQELPLPNPGVDLRPLTLQEQAAHFTLARTYTDLDYTAILDQTEHDLIV